MNRKESLIFWLITILGIGLRFGLALVNRDANDDHLEVINLIVSDWRLLDVADCWQCYHPQLYHFTCATLFKIFHATEINLQYLIAQLVNTMASIPLLWIGWRFIKLFSWPNWVMLIGYGFIALNPKLIGINAMATNDTFIILFASLCVYHLYVFIQKQRLSSGLFLAVFTFLGGLSKGSGLLLILLVAISLCLVIASRLRQKQSVAAEIRTLSLIILFSIAVPYLGSYTKSFEHTGWEFTSNLKKVDQPEDTQRRFLQRPGYDGFANTFLTFRLIDLMKTPFIRPAEEETYASNRSSFWSQIYGRTYFLHFDHWPSSWRLNNPDLFIVGRIMLFLGLVPTMFFLLGLWTEFKSTVLKVIKKSSPELVPSIFLLLLFGFVTALMFRTAKYIDFAIMKPIFLFPVILCFIYFLGIGLSKHVKGKGLVKQTAIGSICLLYCLFIMESGYLIYQLYS